MLWPKQKAAAYALCSPSGLPPRAYCHPSSAPCDRNAAYSPLYSQNRPHSANSAMNMTTPCQITPPIGIRQTSSGKSLEHIPREKLRHLPS